jgi:hypothetical protein
MVLWRCGTEFEQRIATLVGHFQGTVAPVWKSALFLCN